MLGSCVQRDSGRTVSCGLITGRGVLGTWEIETTRERSDLAARSVGTPRVLLARRTNRRIQGRLIANTPWSSFAPKAIRRGAPGCAAARHSVVSGWPPVGQSFGIFVQVHSGCQDPLLGLVRRAFVALRS